MIEELLRSILSALIVVLALVVVSCGDRGPVATTTLPVGPSSSTSVPVVSTSTTEPSVTTTTQPTTTTSSLPLGQQLVINSEFDAGDALPSGWQFDAPGEGQTVEYVREAGEGHISLFAPIVDGDGWPQARLAQPFRVTPHTEYLVTAEARTFTQGRLLLALVFLDEDGDEILLRGPGSPEISSSDWSQYGGAIESPVGAAAAFLVLRLPVSPELTDADSYAVDVNRVSVSEILEQ